MMISVVLAYGFVWAAVCGYVFFIQRKQKSLERDLEMLKEMLPQ